ADPTAMAAALGVDEVGADAVEAARIAAGVPRVGVDTGPKTLVQEAGLQDVAVSFTKGCYLGQETVARAQYGGRVNRTLRLLALEGPPPELPAGVMLEGRPVGELTSAAPDADGSWSGLGILRRQAETGTRVSVGDDGAGA